VPVFALDGNIASHHFDKGFANRKPKAGSHNIPVLGCIGLLKGVEQHWQILFPYSYA
jgi:hypothetical protein